MNDKNTIRQIARTYSLLLLLAATAAAQPVHWQLRLTLPDGASPSRREAGALAAKFEWFKDGKPYSGLVPIPTRQHDQLEFAIPKQQVGDGEGPLLRVIFKAFQAPYKNSPFDDKTTRQLRGPGIFPIEPIGPADEYFRYGPFSLVNPGQEYEFSLQIQIGSSPTFWFVDPQMDVEGGSQDPDGGSRSLP